MGSIAPTATSHWPGSGATDWGVFFTAPSGTLKTTSVCLSSERCCSTLYFGSPDRLTRCDAPLGSQSPAPSLSRDGINNLGAPNSEFAPGAIVALRGQGLTSGSSLSAPGTPLPVRLAGTHLEVNGEPAPLFSVAPDVVLARLPSDLAAGADASLIISSVNRAAGPIPLHIGAAAPGIIAVSRMGDVLSVYATGLGATDPSVDAAAQSPFQPLARTRAQPSVHVQNQPAAVQFSGLAPGLVGVYQINAVLPAGLAGAVDIVVESSGNASDPFHFELCADAPAIGVPGCVAAPL